MYSWRACAQNNRRAGGCQPRVRPRQPFPFRLGAPPGGNRADGPEGGRSARRSRWPRGNKCRVPGRKSRAPQRTRPAAAPRGKERGNRPEPLGLQASRAPGSGSSATANGAWDHLGLVRIAPVPGGFGSRWDSPDIGRVRLTRVQMLDESSRFPGARPGDGGPGTQFFYSRSPVADAAAGSGPAPAAGRGCFGVFAEDLGGWLRCPPRPEPQARERGSGSGNLVLA